MPDYRICVHCSGVVWLSEKVREAGFTGKFCVCFGVEKVGFFLPNVEMFVSFLHLCAVRVWFFSQVEGSLPIAGLGKGIKNFVFFERYVDIFFPRVVGGSGMFVLFRMLVGGRGMHTSLCRLWLDNMALEDLKKYPRSQQNQFPLTDATVILVLPVIYIHPFTQVNMTQLRI